MNWERIFTALGITVFVVIVLAVVIGIFHLLEWLYCHGYGWLAWVLLLMFVFAIVYREIGDN